MASVTIRNVTKSFDDIEVLHSMSETFADGEFITLLGPSGCGKTTMLRLIAGFEKPTTGSISIGDMLVSGEGAFIPPEKRKIGMVFQSYAVWPHMTVFENIVYPLKLMKLSKEEIRNKGETILKTVHLSQYADRLPSQLSGGQQQRVALGRALVAEPEILLLDEPLSNLDAKLREEMRYEIKEITQKLGITVVYVTHDQIEAMTMSDRIVLMNQGQVQQIGAPTELYNNPANQFVANFIGRVNFLPATAQNGIITIEGTDQHLPAKNNESGKAVVAVRPERILINEAANADMPVLKGTVNAQFYLGDINDVRVSVGSHAMRITARASSYQNLHVGDAISMMIEDYMVFPETGEDFTKIRT